MINFCIKNNFFVHDYNGDEIMNKYDLWLLFTKTGKIEYYLKYKNYKESVIEDDQKSGRNHS